MLRAIMGISARAISARTKAALAAAKANGKKLGNYRRIAEAKQRATTARAESVRGAIADTAHLSTRAAADAVNRRSIRTRAAGSGMRCRCFVRAIVSAYDGRGFLGVGNSPAGRGIAHPRRQRLDALSLVVEPQLKSPTRWRSRGSEYCCCITSAGPALN